MLDSISPIKGFFLASIVAYSATQFDFSEAPVKKTEDKSQVIKTDSIMGYSPTDSTSIPSQNQSEPRIFSVNSFNNEAATSPSDIDHYQKQYDQALSMLSNDNSSKEDIEKGFYMVKDSADHGVEDAQHLLFQMFEHEFAYKENDTHELIPEHYTASLEGAADNLNDFSRHFPYLIVKKVESVYKYGFKSLIYRVPEVEKYERIVAKDISSAVNNMSSAITADQRNR